jgi:hypothetical protein
MSSCTSDSCLEAKVDRGIQKLLLTGLVRKFLSEKFSFFMGKLRRIVGKLI